MEVLKNNFKNEILKGFKLSKKIEIYIPTTTDANQTTDTSEYINEAMALLSQINGGATHTKATGGWMSEKHGLIKEDINIIYSYYNDMDDSDFYRIILFINKMKHELKQEAMAMNFENELYFI